MSNRLQIILQKYGLQRGIERHNFLIKYVLREHAKKYNYRGRVIDLGCGNSEFRELILTTAQEYVGVDHPKSRYQGLYTDIRADISRHIPCPEASFDTAIAFQVLDDLPEPSLFLDECFRLLKPNGSLFLTVPFMWKLHEEPYDYFRFTKYGLMYLLKKSGFKEIQVMEIYSGFWGMWILKFNYFSLSLLRPWNKYLLYALWWFLQVMAIFLDQFSFSQSSSEATHYSVTASK